MVLAVNLSAHVLSGNNPAHQNDPGGRIDFPSILEQYLLWQTHRSISERKEVRGVDALEKVEQTNLNRKSEFDDDHIGIGRDDANPHITH